MRKNNWKVNVEGRGLSVDEIFNRIMCARGIENKELFLNPSDGYILPSKALKNIDSAATVFLEGIRNHKNFLIYADVDVDGCTSAAIIYHFLKNFDIEADTYINKGKDHGVQEEFEPPENTDIIVIVDSINDDTKAYRKIMDRGIQLIVLDHHIPTQEVLSIQEEIHLVSSANEYPNPHLSGSGVCWKFVRYIDSIINTNYSPELADLAATGIIADVCCVGLESMENRAICNVGFKSLNNIALQILSGKLELDATTIGFSIGPLINAANRMNCNDVALRLFLTDSSVEAKKLQKLLVKQKELQKELVNKQFTNMESEAEVQKDHKVLFFFIGTNDNMAGLLATKATSKWNRPCIVLNTNDPDRYSGSIRASGNINFRQIVNDSGLADCQGHENSAGITIPRQNLEALSSYLENALSNYDINSDIVADVHVETMQVTPFLTKMIENINRISGVGFPSVQVLIENVKNYNVKKLSGGKHICLSTYSMNFIQWNFDDWDNVIENSTLSAIGRLEDSFFCGKRSTQLLMEDYLFQNIPQVNFLW